jgi:hypothetical protein
LEHRLFDCSFLVYSENSFQKPFVFLRNVGVAKECVLFIPPFLEFESSVLAA